MTNAECLKRLEKIAYTAGINQRYHQQFQWWWSIADKAVEFAVGILAVIGVFVLTPGRESWAAVVAFLALIAAIVLNIIPSAERTILRRSIPPMERSTERRGVRESTACGARF